LLFPLPERLAMEEQAWNRVVSRRNKKNGGNNHQLQALAQQLRDALSLKPPREQSKPQRRPEWQCTGCGTHNFLDRQVCRRCSLAHSQSPKAPPAWPEVSLPRGSVWASSSREKTPAKRAAALEQAAATAKAAGASAETLATLACEAASAKQEAADSRPVGARLDSARAKARRARAAADAAEKAVEQAELRQAEALQQAAEADAALAALEEDLATHRSPLELMQGVLEGARALLQQLESTPLTVPGELAPPERVLAGMRDLQTALAAADPSEPVEMALDEELGATNELQTEAPERRCVAPAVATSPAACAAAFRGAASEADFWDDLQISADADDATIAAMVRQKVRAKPY
jgi:hypothetical protein